MTNTVVGWRQGPEENAAHCKPGKMYNPVTKRCFTRKQMRLRNICPPGKVLNSVTRRFRKERVPKVKITKVCPPGKYLNKSTGRFRKLKNTK